MIGLWPVYSILTPVVLVRAPKRCRALTAALLCWVSPPMTVRALRLNGGGSLRRRVGCVQFTQFMGMLLVNAFQPRTKFFDQTSPRSLRDPDASEGRAE